MKKYIIAVIIINTIITPRIASAQVTINTKNSPSNTALLIDAKGDTEIGGTTNTSDDVFISNTGYIGIGTTTPSAKLDIKGQIKITDGTSLPDHVFTSEGSTGLGFWKELSIVKNFAVWKVSANNVSSIPANIYYNISGTSAISLNSLKATTNDTNNIQIPAGKYMFFIRADINIREYGRIYVYSGSSPIFFKWYSEYLGGGTFYREFASATTLTMGFIPTDVRSNTASAIPFLTATPYSNVNIWAELIIMEL
ncbi:MAG: hypothetical protein QM653_15740 [Dysgonomonas sp.]|uniref:hypothetical protein n=1 Tax=Dysgonomonas sp. TaxID=1891233 RepID=UPI0039E2888B